MGLSLYFWCVLLIVFMVALVSHSLYKYHVLKNQFHSLQNEYKSHVLNHARDLRTICHNINTPLNGVFAVIELFKTQMFGKLPSEYQDYTDMALDSVDDLRKNLEDILQYCDNYVIDQKIVEKSHDAQIDVHDAYVLQPVTVSMNN